MRQLFRDSLPGLAALAMVLGAAGAGFGASLSVEQKAVSTGGRSYSVKVVRVPLDSYRVKVGLANGRVGATAPLTSIAKLYGAVAAINGCFFSAYVSDPIKPPWHHLITDGQLVHHGNTGTTLGFDAEGNYRMERLQIRILGTVSQGEGRSRNWYAYRVNFPPGSSGAIVYDRYWIGAKTPVGGRQAVVQDGVVQSVGSGGLAIPKGGNVLAFIGGDSHLGGLFQPNAQVTTEVSYGSQDEPFWQQAQEGIGCGPRLLTEGRVTYDPPGEGFSSPKILSISGSRSALGVTRDRTLLLVTTGATVRQLADIMKALGAYDAMNLDGGASSSLWVQGKYLVSPGRNISNALVILKR